MVQAHRHRLYGCCTGPHLKDNQVVPIEIPSLHHNPRRLSPLSRPGKPSPLFLGFILASGGRLDSFLRSNSITARTTVKTPTRNITIEALAQLKLGDGSALLSSPTHH